MEQSRERAARLVEEMLPVVRELGAEGREAVEEAERIAYANYDRLGKVGVELEDLKEQAEAIRRGLAAAPAKLAQAHLDEEWETEDRIKENYKNLKARLEGIEERRGELEGEARELQGPNASRKDDPHRYEALIYQRRRISRALLDALASMDVFKELTVAITNEVHGLEGRALTNRSESEGLSTQVFSDTHRKKHEVERPGRGLTGSKAKV